MYLPPSPRGWPSLGVDRLLRLEDMERFLCKRKKERKKERKIMFFQYY